MEEYLSDINELQSVIEAIIFTSGEPISYPKLFEIFIAKKYAEQKDYIIIKKKIKEAVNLIKIEFNEKKNHGIYLSENGEYLSFKTKAEHYMAISEFLAVKLQKFTRVQLETLAVIAYKQPVIKSEIEQIRGVDSGNVIRFLLDKNLIRIAGKKDVIGKPLIYKTTNFFLEVFNLKGLDELPAEKDMNDLFALHNNQININANDNNNKNEETDNDNKDLNETQGFLF
ncbi:MAG: SMC-Scp complex subunit ScpB [bacterium]